MHKSELISGLRSKLHKITESIDGNNRHQWCLGQQAFAGYLIHYLENLDIPNDEEYKHWRIEPYLPKLMVDAFEQLRTGTDKTTAKYRTMYEEETGHQVPNVVDVGESDILDQSLAVQTTIGFLLKEVTGQEWVNKDIETYCNAQKHVLQQTFDKFVRRVYRRGMSDAVGKCLSRGMSGRFGEVELRTFTTMGRVLFTFARRIDNSKEGDERYFNEHTVSFVAADDDPLCLSAGLQSVHADFRTALDLIEAVVKNWPPDTSEQRKLFKEDTKIGIV